MSRVRFDGRDEGGGRRGTREITRLALLYTNHCRSSEVALTPYLERHRRTFFCVRAGIPLVTPEEAAREKNLASAPDSSNPLRHLRLRHLQTAREGLKRVHALGFTLAFGSGKGRRDQRCPVTPLPLLATLDKIPPPPPLPSLVISRSPRRSQREIEREREREAKSARGGQ